MVDQRSALVSTPRRPPPSDPGPMATHVYIDGPSLYYGALKDRLGRWLDLQAWCEQAAPRPRRCQRSTTSRPGRRNRRPAPCCASASTSGPWRRSRRRRRTSAASCATAGAPSTASTACASSTSGGDPRRRRGADHGAADRRLQRRLRRRHRRHVELRTAHPDRRRAPARRLVRHRQPAPGEGRATALREYADFFIRPSATSYVAAQHPRTIHGRARHDHGAAVGRALS